MHALLDTCIANSCSRGTCRLVLLLLARAANAGGYVSVSFRWLSECSGMGLQTCREALEHLIGLNEVRLVEVGGGKARANLYRVMVRRIRPLPPFRSVPEG